MACGFYTKEYNSDIIYTYLANKFKRTIGEKMKKSEVRNLVGCCGLYCGLCSKYQSKAASRCIGCKPGEQHSWCSIWNCCVKKHKFETCSECEEVFRCDIYLRRKVSEWIPAADNLRRIKEAGLKNWLNEQIERQALVEKLLLNYNEGRSMSFYCRACSRISIESIDKAIKETKKKLVSEKSDESDIKSKAKILKAVIKDSASKANVNLKEA